MIFTLNFKNKNTIFKNIRDKMLQVKNNYQERVIYSPNTNLQPERYATPQTPTARK